MKTGYKTGDKQTDSIQTPLPMIEKVPSGRGKASSKDSSSMFHSIIWCSYKVDL